jgi:hypothetical protein
MRRLRRRGGARGVVRTEAEVGEAGELLLVHRNAAGDLAQVFAEGDLDQKLLGLAEAAGVASRSA